MRTVPAGVVRGTQTFVGVMGQVWRRPSLTALEIFWRWVVGALLLLTALPDALQALGAVSFRQGGFEVSPALTAPLATLSVFHPVAAVESVHLLAATFLVPARHWLGWAVAAVVVGWNLIAALGRTMVLQRLDGTLHARRRTLWVLGTLRSALLLGAWMLWIRGVGWAAQVAITGPAAQHEDPSVVLFAAMLIAGTLLLYVAWGIVAWPWTLAPLLAMRWRLGVFAALARALGSRRELRGKLIEVNLVLHIVRLCLLVLAMVFSATPLPFADVTTPLFLFWWWTAVGLAFFAFTDYFHVVRAAAYLALEGVYERSAAGAASAA